MSKRRMTGKKDLNRNNSTHSNYNIEAIIEKEKYANERASRVNANERERNNRDSRAAGKMASQYNNRGDGYDNGKGKKISIMDMKKQLDGEEPALNPSKYSDTLCTRVFPTESAQST